MTAAEIRKIVDAVARQYKLDCKFPLQVFGSKDLGCAYRSRIIRDGHVQRAMFAISEDDTIDLVWEKAKVAANCLEYLITTGFNKVDQKPVLNMMEAG